MKTADRIRMTYWMEPETNSRAVAAAKSQGVSLTGFITECVEARLRRLSPPDRPKREPAIPPDLKSAALAICKRRRIPLVALVIEALGEKVQKDRCAQRFGYVVNMDKTTGYVPPEDASSSPGEAAQRLADALILNGRIAEEAGASMWGKE